MCSPVIYYSVSFVLVDLVDVWISSEIENWQIKMSCESFPTLTICLFSLIQDFVQTQHPFACFVLLGKLVNFMVKLVQTRRICYLKFHV